MQTELSCQKNPKKTLHTHHVVRYTGTNLNVLNFNPDEQNTSMLSLLNIDWDKK